MLFSNGRSVRMETQTGIAFLSDHSFVNPLKLHLQPDSTENNRGHSYLSCHHFLFIPCMSSIFIRHHLGFWSPHHARVTKDWQISRLQFHQALLKCINCPSCTFISLLKKNNITFSWRKSHCNFSLLIWSHIPWSC